MALRQNVESLIASMQGGDILGAFDRWYADGVEMQENTSPATVGKAANRVREEQFLASVKEWKSLDIHAVAVDEASGVAFIEYGFSFVNHDGQLVNYAQSAVQRWKDGKIASERFYYNAG